jgi:tetratricopeptide (TPR) repeat protein
MTNRALSLLATVPVASTLGAGVLATLLAGSARADEIRWVEPTTEETKVEKAFEITDETWTHISYRQKDKGPIKKIETRFVVDVRRTGDDANIASFREALDNFNKGNYRPAAVAFAQVAGGGLRKNPDTDAEEYRPFASEGGDPKWYAEYAHYWFARAMYEHGRAKNDAKSLDYAFRAVASDSKDDKGFLARFKEGKSRYYAEAMLLKAEVLLAQKKADEALAAFKALGEAATKNPLNPRWTYEAQRGLGRVAEAKGQRPEAEAAYDAATSVLQSNIEGASDAAPRRAFGRWYSEMRMQKARVVREGAAESNSPPEYKRLREYLTDSSPDRLRTKFAGKPAEMVEAVVSGAMSPTVQAVAQNGIGLANLHEKKYVDALFAFDAVRIKYFQVTEEVPQALYYLAQAATAAAEAATNPNVKALYKSQADAARQELTRSYPDSPWAKK